MNRKFKKILSTVLIVVMVFCTVPVMTYATDSDDYCSYKVGDIIEFGSYPQSQVTDEETLKALNSLELNWISYDYYSGIYHDDAPSLTLINSMETQKNDHTKYSDFSYNGEKYRAVCFEEYRPGNVVQAPSSDYSFQDENRYYPNITYFFKYEPIQWILVDQNGTLMSRYILDSQYYSVFVFTDYFTDHLKECLYTDNTRTTEYTYSISYIKEWLNDDFYNTSFCEQEKSIIQNKYINENINKVYIPSYEQILGDNCCKYFSIYGTPSRCASVSDYAASQGAYIDSSRGYGTYMYRKYDNNSLYQAHTIHSSGVAIGYILMNPGSHYGIRPFIELKELVNHKEKHIAGKWQTIKEPTYDENGEKAVYCTKCKKLLESEVIPKLKTGLKSITLPYFELEIQYKNSATLKPTVDCEQDYTLRYSSSDEEVLTIDENGKITTHSRGTATVTCTATDEDGKTLTDTCEVTVKYNFWQWIARIFLFIIGVNSRI